MHKKEMKINPEQMFRTVLRILNHCTKKGPTTAFLDPLRRLVAVISAYLMGNGQINPTVDILWKILDVLNIRFSYMMQLAEKELSNG